MWLIFLIIPLLLTLWASRRPPRLLRRGVFRKRRRVDGFYIEEVVFKDYQAAISGYFRLSADLYGYGEVCETRYDFLDFYSVMMRFPDCTLRLVRIIDRVRLIKSTAPMSMDAFGQASAAVAYRDI